jgi:uncharacterized protein
MNATIVLTQPALSPFIPRLRSVDLTGPAGRLEAVLNDGDPDASFAALVCHPHPLGGGNLHNKVVYHAMKVLNEPRWGFNLPVLRFNFRGTGISKGIHDGEAEADDVLAALTWLEYEFNRPIILVGFSFGAAMSIAALNRGHQFRSGIRALIALGLPVQSSGRTYSYPTFEHNPLPRLFISGDRDQFAPARELTKIVDSMVDPKQLAFIKDSDHFFTGHITAMQKLLATWLKEQMQ